MQKKINENGKNQERQKELKNNGNKLKINKKKFKKIDKN